MIREQAKNIIPVLQAYADGKDVEMYDPIRGTWVPAPYPSFAEGDKYRIKGEQEYRPFKSKTECLNEIHKHNLTNWIKDEDNFYQILILTDEYIHLHDSTGDYGSISYKAGYTYETAFKKFKFIDGTPFGALK